MNNSTILIEVILNYLKLKQVSQKKSQKMKKSFSGAMKNIKIYTIKLKMHCNYHIYVTAMLQFGNFWNILTSKIMYTNKKHPITFSSKNSYSI